MDEHTVARPDPAPNLPPIFRTVNGAIALAIAEDDATTVEYLLIAKLAMLRRYHGRPS